VGELVEIRGRKWLGRVLRL